MYGIGCCYNVERLRRKMLCANPTTLPVTGQYVLEVENWFFVRISVGCLDVVAEGDNL